MLVPHASDRLARAIVRVRLHERDPRTFALWADANAVTPGRLHAWCRAAAVPGRSALEFARMLRAVTLVDRDGWRYEELLDVAEPRALARLLWRAGLRGDHEGQDGIDTFLTRQTLVCQTLLVQRVRDLICRQEAPN